jgi:hypothetical protein
VLAAPTCCVLHQTQRTYQTHRLVPKVVKAHPAWTESAHAPRCCSCSTRPSPASRARWNTACRRASSCAPRPRPGQGAAGFMRWGTGFVSRLRGGLHAVGDRLRVSLARRASCGGGQASCGGGQASCLACAGFMRWGTGFMRWGTGFVSRLRGGMLQGARRTRSHCSPRMWQRARWVSSLTRARRCA